MHPVAVRYPPLVSGLAIVADRLKEEDGVLVMISELEQFEVDAHGSPRGSGPSSWPSPRTPRPRRRPSWAPSPHRVGREAAAELLSRFGMVEQVDPTGLTGSFAAMMGEVRDELGALDRAR